MDYKDFAAMMDKATNNGGPLRPDILPEDQARFWYDRVHIEYKPGIGSVFAEEPCDDSDDGFNKTSSVDEIVCPVTFHGNTQNWVFIDPRDSYQAYAFLYHVPARVGYLGITYKIGDTTTFSPGPYDESLGVPVTVHFKG